MVGRIFLALCASSLLLPSLSSAQVVVNRLPGGRRIPPSMRHQMRVENVEVNATVKDQAATVQIAQTFRNNSSRTIESQFLFPMPEGVAISGLTLVVNGKELPGELKPKDQARSIYESIVRQQKDPALLEYIGDGVYKTSVFPIPPRQERRVEIRYTQLLQKDSGLVDFTLPLGTIKHTQQPIEKTKVTVRVSTTKPIKTMYSPTHDFDIDRKGEDRAVCTLDLKNVTRPNDVRLMFGTKGGDVGMNLVSYRPDPKKDGYFLLLASPRVKVKKGAKIAKTVIFVVDRSGSMAGEKIEQAKKSLKYMINKLGDKDKFNIISYSSSVETFRPELEVVNSDTRKSALAFVEDMYSGGGTNINDALKTALKQLADKKRPNYVLFFTDGLPTVGATDEKTIAGNAEEANGVSARLFNFGVGYDVNSRLLDRLSTQNRGTSVFVKPSEDIEVAATSLFKKVSSPAMVNIAVKIKPEEHDSERKAIRRVYPSELTDLFRGEQLVLVGRYRTSGPTSVTLTGDVNGKEKTFKVEAKLARHSKGTSHAYVEKLWATRRIGEIIGELDLNGKNKELTDELVKLSLKHGIMTPYTSFLADENVQLANQRQNRDRAGRSLESLSIASGRDGFAQRDYKKRLRSANSSKMPSFYSRGGGFDSRGGVGGGGGLSSDSESRGLSAGGGRSAGSTPARSRFGANAGQKRGGEKGKPATNAAKEEGGQKASVADRSKSTVQSRVRQIGAKTFYWKSKMWQDAAIANSKDVKPVKVVQYSKAYFDLAAKDKGKWSKFLALTEPMLIKLGDVIYRIVPDDFDDEQDVVKESISKKKEPKSDK